jgi:membrane protein DedA with SNARE-associated domain
VAETIDQYGLALLFAIIALQAMGVAGLPGKTSLVAAAILAAEGTFEIWEVIAVAAAAGLVGGYAGYTIGRLGGRPLVDRTRLGRRLGAPIAMAERFFATHGSKAVFFARFLPGLKVVAAPAAGISRMSWPPFALWHALGALGFAVLFGLGGYYLGRGAIEVVEALGLYALVGVAGVLVACWLLWSAMTRSGGTRPFGRRALPSQGSRRR